MFAWWLRGYLQANTTKEVVPVQVLQAMLNQVVAYDAPPAPSAPRQGGCGCGGR